MLDEKQLGDFIAEHFAHPGQTLFRMEVFPVYAVETDGEDFQRWLNGATEPTWSRKGPWLKVLRGEREQGLISRRVRVLGSTETGELTDYEKFACDFGYRYNAEAGEDVRVLHRHEHPLPAGLIERDFWIVDDQHVVSMHYDSKGRFLGADIANPAVLIEHMRCREAAWDAAEPFLEWWARHPELHQARQAA